MGLPIQRVIAKLEYYFGQEDLTSARSLLEYWLDEAKAQGDERGLVEILNEQLGLYRRLNDEEASDRTIEALLPLLRDGGRLETLSGATMLLNIATNHCHFGRPQEAQPLYPEVEATFDKLLPAFDYRRAGLANNRAASLCATARYDDAAQLYGRALEQLGHLDGYESEIAVTLVNRATARYQAYPLDERVDEDMREAYRVLTSDIAQDSNYIFVLGKLIPIYAHLGYREEAADLSARKQAAQAAARG